MSNMFRRYLHCFGVNFTLFASDQGRFTLVQGHFRRRDFFVQERHQGTDFDPLLEMVEHRGIDVHLQICWGEKNTDKSEKMCKDEIRFAKMRKE